MMKVKTTQEIQIYRGDSGYCTLHLNQGTKLSPIPFTIDTDISIECSSSNVKAELDVGKWKNKVLVPGEYKFIYQYNSWRLDEHTVDISSYGFNIIQIQSGQYIKVNYLLPSSQSEIYFYIFQINQDPRKLPLFTKVIKPYSNIEEGYMLNKKVYEYNRNCTDDRNNVIVYFEPEDTRFLEEGKYLYQIKSKLYNQSTNLYDELTLTNKLPFTVIDDNYSERDW